MKIHFLIFVFILFVGGAKAQDSISCNTKQLSPKNLKKMLIGTWIDVTYQLKTPDRLIITKSKAKSVLFLDTLFHNYKLKYLDSGDTYITPNIYLTRVHAGYSIIANNANGLILYSVSKRYLRIGELGHLIYKRQEISN